MNAPSGEALLSVSGLTVNYGHIEAVRDIDFALQAGRIIARGGPEAIRTDPQVIEAYLGREEDEAEAEADARTVAAVTARDGGAR